MNLQRSFDPAATEDALTVVEHRRLAWSHSWIGFSEPDFRPAFGPRHNTCGNRRMTVANLHPRLDLLRLSTCHPVNCLGYQAAGHEPVLAADRDTTAVRIDVGDVPRFG